MKKRIYPFVIFFVFIGMSCVDKYDVDKMNASAESNKIVLTSEEYVSIAYDHPKELSEKDILNIVYDFQSINSNLEKDVKTKNLEVQKASVVNKYYFSNRDKAIDYNKTRSANSLEINIPIYEVELANGVDRKDFAIVCGDERIPKVLFYVSDYDLSNRDNIELQYLIELAKRSAFSDIELVETIRIEKRDSTLNKVSKELNIPKEQITESIIKERIVTTDDILTKTYNPIGGEPIQKLTRIVSVVGPLSRISWHQAHPYNTQMPTGLLWDGHSPYTGHYDVGCANIGVATLFSILRPSMVGVTAGGRQILIDWDYITSEERLFIDYVNPANSSPARMVEMVGCLLRQIYNETKSKPVKAIKEGHDADLNPMDVEVIVETSTMALDMVDYLKTMTIYSGSTKFNSNQAMQSLQELKPVLLYGNGHFIDDNRNLIQDEEYKDWQPGHAWLIDGYCMTKKSGQATNDLYWSVNMGWGIGSSKVYFKTSNDFQNCDVVFNHNMISNVNIVYYAQEQNMIYNIIKK